MPSIPSTTPLPLWLESERPREKLLKLGAGALSEAELLAILLQTGTPGRSALDTARMLLGEFRSLRGLLTAERRQSAAPRAWGRPSSRCCRRRSSFPAGTTPS